MNNADSGSRDRPLETPKLRARLSEHQRERVYNTATEGVPNRGEVRV